MSYTPLSSSIAAAITWMEGAKPGTNNPGNIMDLAYYNATGQFRIQQYTTLDEGQAALADQIARNIGRGLTLQEFFAGKPGVYGGYAPAGHGGNDPTAYAAFVAQQAGIPVDVPLDQLQGGGGSWYTGDTGGSSVVQDAVAGPGDGSSIPLAVGLAAGLLLLVALTR